MWVGTGCVWIGTGCVRDGPGIRCVCMRWGWLCVGLSGRLWVWFEISQGLVNTHNIIIRRCLLKTTFTFYITFMSIRTLFEIL